MTVKMKKYTIAQYEQRISDIREARVEDNNE